ncbi:NADP-dependent oxidoreductase [Micromonospora sp. NPDC050397]|uniref:NADP-dependent oxidoreductase n=1 Tax=Micromonospora sp. NPDC050397 TaxID=3364279 RepID=UPI003850F18B
MSRAGREVRLASRPHGWPTPENFDLVKVSVPDPGPGQLLVRNVWMSVDPYMRGRMDDRRSYSPPYALGEVLDGGAIGEVVSSETDAFRPGDLVRHGKGWREYAVLDERAAQRVDQTVAPVSAYLGPLSGIGLTAYVGLLDVAALRPGEAVFVSAAAGAVGSLTGQIAKLKGAARVVGSAGSDEKVARLLDLGFDAAFNYRAQPVRRSLKEAAPEGIDVYFDNVGADHLEAAIACMRLNGRVAICGMISQYNATEPVPGPRNLSLAVSKRLTLRGFLLYDHLGRREQFVGEMSEWLRSGQIRYHETVVDGLENAPAAFLGLLRGENFGKMLVRL